MTVATLVTKPAAISAAITVYVAVGVMLAPGARLATGSIELILSSAIDKFVNVTLPVLVIL